MTKKEGEEVKVGDDFVTMLLLQSISQKERYLLQILDKVLDKVSKETPNGIISNYKAFRVCGKHDIMVIIYSNKLAQAVMLIYEIIKFINKEFSTLDSPLITDFTKIIGFRWTKRIDTREKKLKNLPALCNTFIKINPLHEEIGKKYEGNAIEVEYRIAEKIRENVEKTREARRMKEDDKNKEIELEVETNGTFTWNEVSCIFYGTSYHDVLKVLKETQEGFPCIYDVITLPIIDERSKKNCEYTPTILKEDMMISRISGEVYLSTLTTLDTGKFDGKFEPLELFSFKPGEEIDPSHTDYWDERIRKMLKFKNIFGGYDLLTYYDKYNGEGPENPLVAVSMLDRLRKNPFVRRTSTYLSIDPENDFWEKENYQNWEWSKGPLKLNTKNSRIMSVEEIDKRVKKISGENLLEIKKTVILNIEALKTLISTLRSADIYNYLLPVNIEKSLQLLIDIDKHVEGFIEEGVLDASESSPLKIMKLRNRFLSEIRYGIQQRLSGCELGALLGMTGGNIEHLGGFQRMILASETIPIKAYYKSEADYNNISTQDVEKVMIFNILDYGEALTILSPKSLLIPRERDVPVLIKIQKAKYEPWQWILSLHEIGHWLYFWSERLRALKKIIRIIDEEKMRLEMNGSEEEDWATNFAMGFIEREFILSSIWNELEIETPEEDGKKYADDEVIHYLEKEIPYKMKVGVLGNTPLTQKNIDEKSVEMFQENISIGYVSLNLNEDVDFFSYLNAYHSLEEKMESPVCFTSFVLSLYNERIKILQRDYKNSMSKG